MRKAHTVPMCELVLLLETQLTASGAAKAACGEPMTNHFCPFLRHFDKGSIQATFKTEPLYFAVSYKSCRLVSEQF